MRITLADSSNARGRRIWERLSRLSGTTLNDRCYGLTDTFKSIEHKPPHIVIYSEDLTQRADFSAMEALCKCLSVRSMVLGGWGTIAKPGIHLLEPTAPDDIFLNALSDCLRSRPAQNVRADAGLFKSSPKTTYTKTVLIGSSTGGIEALLKVLGAFPVDCPPTVIVQHTGVGFGAGLVRVLNQRVEPMVREARHGETLKPGNILIALGSEAHLRLKSGAPLTCQLEKGEGFTGHCPSVDALFSSAIPVAKNITAAILTGMGRDGAESLLALRKAGARTICQDEATSVVYGMPGAAAKLGAAEQILPLSSIGPALLRASQEQVPTCTAS
jgi:two-component system chemotaxis response regulator CheB|tara:strand:+ start:9405 stop:10391 length:987 start_codon:yes stop_codon:yes gene_type:complete